MAIVMQTTFGVIGALVFDRTFKGRGILRTIFILPMATTPVAISLVWILMMNPTTGVLNYFLSLIYVKPALWVFSRKTVLFSLALVDTWMWTPFLMLITLGGLSSLPLEPYESAKIDGANSWQIFWRITLPLLRPFIAVGVILRTIDALKTFDIIFVMTQGGPGTASETLNVFLFLKGFYQFHMGYASAVAVIYFVIILAVCLILLGFRRAE
jgi:multiple sugar transport system permease protein